MTNAWLRYLVECRSGPGTRLQEGNLQPHTAALQLKPRSCRPPTVSHDNAPCQHSLSSAQDTQLQHLLIDCVAGMLGQVALGRGEGGAPGRHQVIVSQLASLQQMELWQIASTCHEIATGSWAQARQLGWRCRRC